MAIERNFMDQRTRFALTTKMHTEYKESGLTDIEFAKKMSAAFGVPLTASHIAGIRHSFDIPANNQASGAGAKSAAERIDALTMRVEGLESELELLRREVKECLHLKGNAR